MNDKITDRFNEALTKLKIKNKDIAEKLNYTSVKVSDIKTGKNKITPEFALELKKEFNINPCWMFFGQGNMTVSVAKFDLTGETKKPMSNDELYKIVEDLAIKVNNMESKYAK
jgi:plasmid maintenance system antidote protein VapI